MRVIVGCSTLLACAAFLIAFIGALIVVEGSLTEQLAMSFMASAFTFVAALILSSRDRVRYAYSMRSIRQMLLNRHDTSELVFSEQFPTVEPSLVSQTRHAIAHFFDVPPEKIYATDDLRRDFQFELLEPAFHSVVVFHVLKARRIEPDAFMFNSGTVSTLADLMIELRRIIDGLESAY